MKSSGWCKGISGVLKRKCLYLYKKDTNVRGLFYVYSQKCLEGHLKIKNITNLEYLDGLSKLGLLK